MFINIPFQIVNISIPILHFLIFFVDLDPSIVEEYIEKGCLMQCNYGSIVNLYGNEAEKTIKTFQNINSCASVS